MAFPQYGSPSPTTPNEDKTPKGGLGQLMQSLLAGGGSNQPGANNPGNPALPSGPPAPPGGPQPAPGGAIPTPGMGGPQGGPPMFPAPGTGPWQGAGMQPGISPEEHAAILEQIKTELMKDIAGQSGQQDRIFAASSGLSRYRPMQSAPPRPGIAPAMPEGVQYPPGMSPAGLDMWRRTGNPNPGAGMPIPPPPQMMPPPPVPGRRSL